MGSLAPLSVVVGVLEPLSPSEAVESAEPESVVVGSAVFVGASVPVAVAVLSVELASVAVAVAEESVELASVAVVVADESVELASIAVADAEESVELASVAVAVAVAEAVELDPEPMLSLVSHAPDLFSSKCTHLKQPLARFGLSSLKMSNSFTSKRSNLASSPRLAE